MVAYTEFTIEEFQAITHIVGILIGSVGVTVILVGVARSFQSFLLKFIKKDILIADIRIRLGHYLALGLEFLVAKDIVESIARPSWEDLGKLAIIIALRTILTFFLAHEVKEVREKLQEENLIHRLRSAAMKEKKERL